MSCLLRNHVADAADIADHARPEFSAQGMDVYLDGIAFHFMAPAVEFFLDLRARKHGSRPLGEGSDGSGAAKDAARTSLGLMPNSRRNARLKLDASAKHNNSAIFATGKRFDASQSSVKLSDNR